MKKILTILLLINLICCSCSKQEIQVTPTNNTPEIEWSVTNIDKLSEYTYIELNQSVKTTADKGISYIDYNIKLDLKSKTQVVTVRCYDNVTDEISEQKFVSSERYGKYYTQYGDKWLPEKMETRVISLNLNLLKNAKEMFFQLYNEIPKNGELNAKLRGNFLSVETINDKTKFEVFGVDFSEIKENRTILNINKETNIPTSLYNKVTYIVNGVSFKTETNIEFVCFSTDSLDIDTIIRSH